MAAEVGSAYISLLPSMQGFGSKVNKDIGGISERAGREGGARFGKVWASTSIAPMRAIGAAAVGLFAADKLAGFFKGAITQASGLSEAGNKISTVFGPATAQVEKFAAGGAKALGLNKLAALDAAATFGVYGKAAGLAGGENAKFSQQLVGLSTDLSSFYNTSPEQAIEAVGAALRGEAEPLRAYGVLLDDATMREQALRMGLIKTTKSALTPQQKVLAAHAVIMKQTKIAQGDFAKTSGGLANQQRILSAQWTDMKGNLGAGLLPVITKLATFANTTLIPGIKAVAGAFKSGQASGTGFTAFMTGLGAVAKAVGGFITTVFGPAFKSLGSSIGSVKGADLAKQMNAVAIAIRDAGTWITGTAVPALVSFGDWVQRNAGTIKTIAGIIGALFIPRLIVLGVTATQSGIAQVRAWVSTQIAAVKSAAVSFASSYKIVAGWVASGAAAARSGAQTVAIWAMYKAEAVKGAAATVAAHARIAASWIASTARSAAAAVASGASVIASYVAQGAAATASGAVQAAAWLRATAAIVANRAVMVAAAVATGVMTAAQWALNVAMTANPIGLVIAAIVLLVGGLILAYKKSETFRNIVNAVFGAVKTFVISAVGVIRSVVVSVFGFLKAYFTTVFNIYRTIIVGAWTGIKVAVAAAVGFVRGYFRLVGAAAQMVAGFFTSMAASVRARVSAVVSVVGSMASRVIGFIKGIPGKILGIGGQIVDGIANGIRGAASRVADAARELANKLPEWVKKVLNINSPSRVMMDLGKWAGLGLAVGIKSSTKDVVRAGEKMADSLRKAVAAKTPGATSALLRTIDRENRQLGRLATQRDAVTKRLAAATKTYTDLVNARTDYAGKVAENARSFAAITAVESGASAKGILANLRSRMVQVQKFADLIKSLKAQGLNATTLDQIVQAGVDQGTGIAVALAKGGSAAIAETNTLQAGISSAAASLGTTAGSAMYDAGVKAAAGIVRGLQSQEKVLAAQMARLAKIMASQIKRSLGIRSPSRVMADEVGRFIPAGIAVGIARHAGLVRSEMDRLAMVPRVAAVRRPLVTAGASSAPVRGGDTYVVHSRAEDPAEVARLVSANNAWHHR